MMRRDQAALLALHGLGIEKVASFNTMPELFVKKPGLGNMWKRFKGRVFPAEARSDLDWASRNYINARPGSTVGRNASSPDGVAAAAAEVQRLAGRHGYMIQNRFGEGLDSPAGAGAFFAGTSRNPQMRRMSDEIGRRTAEMMDDPVFKGGGSAQMAVRKRSPTVRIPTDGEQRR
jgi:hypothetical protein